MEFPTKVICSACKHYRLLGNPHKCVAPAKRCLWNDYEDCVQLKARKRHHKFFNDDMLFYMMNSEKQVRARKVCGRRGSRPEFFGPEYIVTARKDLLTFQEVHAKDIVGGVK